MKKIFITLMSVLVTCGLYAQQRVMTEGTVIYNLTVNGSAAQEAANVFNGATLTVYFKGNQALQELKSSVLNQSTIYDGNNASAVILKQSGDQKFIINLDSNNWQHYNRRYEGITFNYTEETKTIAGFACKKAIAKLSDGTELAVYYATTLSPFVKGYEYQFRNLPGLALEYEVQNGQMKVTYRAKEVINNPVPAFKFDVPKTGYRILDYKSS
jgi:GLPGLI family protein